MAKGDNWTTAMALMVKNAAKAAQAPGVRMAEVTSLKPFKIKYNDVEFSSDRDYIYMNDLLLDENINIDVDAAMSGTQNLQGVNPQPWIALNTPQADYTAQISGTIPDFIKEFYNWFKTWHNRYILHIGDLVAIQKIGENKIIVLNKVQRIIQQQEGTEQ